MKILAISDAGCTTGFGHVADALYRDWCQQGHDVHVLAINYQGDPWDAPYKLYVASKHDPADMLGFRRVVELTTKVEPDCVFLLNDLPIIAQYLWANMFDAEHILLTKPLVIYAPVDCVGLPPSWSWPVEAADVAIVQSNFGQQVLLDEFGLAPWVLGHGVRESFYPFSDERPGVLFAIENGERRPIRLATKSDVKTVMHWDNRFVIINVSRNTQRKNWGDTFRVFAEFVKTHDDALLYCHTKIRDGGVDLTDLIARYHLEKYVQYPANLDPFVGVEDPALNAYYNAADVFLTTTLGEGFGIPLAEAMACEVPVVAPKFSACAEVVGPGGICVDETRRWASGRGVDLSLPNCDQILAALEDLYSHADRRKILGRRGHHYVDEHWRWPKILPGFRQALQEAVERFQADGPPPARKLITERVRKNVEAAGGV